MNERRHRLSRLLVAVMLLSWASACTSGSLFHRVGRVDTGVAYDVYVQGDYAYVANNEGVVVIDIKDHQHPKQISLLDLGEAAFGVYVQDDRLYAGGGGEGFFIADVSDPALPVMLGSLPTGVAEGMQVADGMAYVSTHAGDLLVVDVHDPTSPALVGRYAGGSMGRDAAYYEGVVYLAAPDQGLLVLDVSDPSAPALLHTVSHTEGAIDIHIVEWTLFLACHGNGVRILDITDPRKPVLLSAIMDSGEAWGVTGDRYRLWIADLQEGVEAYDVSDSLHPRRVTEIKRYAPHDIFCDGAYLYLADQDRGFVILEYREF